MEEQCNIRNFVSGIENLKSKKRFNHLSVIGKTIEMHDACKVIVIMAYPLIFHRGMMDVLLRCHYQQKRHVNMTSAKDTKSPYYLT